MCSNLALIAGKNLKCCWAVAATLLLACLTADSVSAEPERRERRILPSCPYATSDILYDGKLHTTVPKGAVLATPSNLASKIVDKPTGSYVSWKEFAKKNYSWLLKKDVSIEQATGKSPLSENELFRLEKSGKVVIAIHKDNPISVRR